MKVGLALSSGGSRGYAHIGVLKVLMKNKISIDCISGTSMGSIIAAFYALYQDVESLEKIALGITRKDVLKLIDFNDPRKSLVKGTRARSFLSTIFGNKTFADTRIPLSIGATDLKNGERVVFRRGKIMNAVVASSAFPGIFPAVKYKGKYLADGGLADATPVSLVQEMGADIIIAVDLFSYDPSRERNYEDVRAVLGRTYEILMTKLANYKVKEFGKNIIVLKPHAGRRLETFAFFNAKKHITAGEQEAQKYISVIKRKIR